MKGSVKGSLTILILALSWQTGLAQLEVSMSVGGGLSSLQPTTYLFGKGGAGFTGGISCAYFISPNLGIGTGVGFGLYNAQITANNRYSILPNQIDDAGNNYDLRSSFAFYREHQRSTMLNIPIMAQFLSSASGGIRGAVGMKIGIPLTATYSAKPFTLQNTAQYADNTSTSDGNTSGIFGEFSRPNVKGDLNFKTAFSIAFEIGRQWRINNNLSVFAGVYVDWGVNNIKQNHLTTFVKPGATPGDFETSSIVIAQQEANKPFVEKISPLSTGVMLKLSLGGPSMERKKPKHSKAKIEEQRQKAEKRAEEQRQKAEVRAEEIRKQRAVAAEEQAFAAELPPPTPESLASERALITRIDSVRESLFEQAAATEGASFAADVRELASPLEGYDLNSHTPSPQLLAALNKKIAILKRYPDKIVIIEGHTCDRGSFEDNFTVGMRRAEVIRDYLIANGIAPNRLRAVSKANTEPRVPNINNVNRRKNRRIEIYMVTGSKLMGLPK